MAGEVQILGGWREIHDGGTEIAETALNPLPNMVLPFILCGRCVSVVRNTVRAEDLIMQNKANFQRHRTDIKWRMEKWLREKDADFASGETKPIPWLDGGHRPWPTVVQNKANLRRHKWTVTAVREKGYRRNRRMMPLQKQSQFPKLVVCPPEHWRGRLALASRRHLAGRKSLGEQGQDGLATKRLTPSLQAGIPLACESGCCILCCDGRMEFYGDQD